MYANWFTTNKGNTDYETIADCSCQASKQDVMQHQSVLTTMKSCKRLATQPLPGKETTKHSCRPNRMETEKQICFQKHHWITGKCSTPNQLLICLSFSGENGKFFLICSSLSTNQIISILVSRYMEEAWKHSWMLLESEDTYVRISSKVPTVVAPWNPKNLWTCKVGPYQTSHK